HTQDAHARLHWLNHLAIAGGNRAVAPALLGLIKSLVGNAEYFSRRHVLARRCYSDADGDTGLFLATASHAATVPSIFATDHEGRLFNDLAHAVDIDEDLIRSFAGKEHGELLAAIAISLSPSGDSRKTRSNHAKRLISGLMPEAVVEFLEMVYVQHGNCVVLRQFQQRLIQCPATGQLGQFIEISHAVRRFEYSNDNGQRPSGKEDPSKTVCGSNP